MSSRITAVLFDFGGVVIRTPFEMAAGLERRLGVPEGSLHLRGPFDPAADPDWREVQSGGLHERDYWQRHADRLASRLGESPDPVRQLIDALFDAPREDVLRSTTMQLRADLVAAGTEVAVLTNDLARFHDPAWIERMDVHRLFDPFVDLSHNGVLKPDPRAYEMALEDLRRPAGEVLFVDDQPVNVAAADEAGMATVRFDVLDPGASADLVREAVGLG